MSGTAKVKSITIVCPITGTEETIADPELWVDCYEYAHVNGCTCGAEHEVAGPI